MTRRRSRRRARGRDLAPLVALILISGACAHFPINQPLGSLGPDDGYRLRSADRAEPDDLTVVLTISGGGSRAAAFGYGVLEGLREVKLEGPSGEVGLLEELDLIAGVSGGSVLAAYYALFGERVFDEFVPRFLERDIEGLLRGRLARPGNWLRLASPNFDRIDLLAETLDHELYKEARFESLEGGSPYLLISATDITRGKAFHFTQEYFDELCSSLSAFPVARAVAASAAVPVALTPVTLRNHGTMACAIRQGKAQGASGPSRGPWLHLHDGGLVGNLGIRPVLEAVRGAPGECGDRPLDVAGRRVVVIVVNSVIELDRSAEEKKQGPSLAQSLIAAVNIPIDDVTASTLASLRPNFEAWLAWADGCAGLDDEPAARSARLYPIVVDFEAVAAWDGEASGRLRQIPGRFHLEAEQLAELRRAGAQVIERSPELARLLADVAADSSPEGGHPPDEKLGLE